MRSDTCPGATVLIVDEDSEVVEVLARILKDQGFAVMGAASGAVGLLRARALRPDVVILEVTLPGMDGFAVLRGLRADGVEVPVLFLTAQTALKDKLRGLAVGGEDYITKPFSPEEVVARLRAVLRRTVEKKPMNPRLVFADVELDTDTHEAWKAGHPVALSPTEFKLLRYLMINPGRALSKTTIMDHVWPHRVDGVKVVETYVSRLRRKIDTADTQLLHTLPKGVGYVLRASA